MKSDKKNKLIPLDKFIYKALYDPKNGYYSKKESFGVSGDFITAPNISILFSEIILIWLVSFWEYLKKPKKINIIEMGAGNGEMTYQIIKSSKNFPEFYNSCRFIIYEKSKSLKSIQRKKLKLYDVSWIGKLDNIKIAPTLFFGNEFFDAMPIKQFVKTNNIWFENYVDSSNNEKKIVKVKTNINKYEKKYGINLSKNQDFIELSPITFKIFKTISKVINKMKGGILIIDYGYGKNKMLDTLQSVKKHKYNNFLKDIGNSDITHLINFKLFEKIVKKLNLKVNGFTTQRKFLINLGILQRAEIIAKKLSIIKKANIFYRVNRLIDNKQMGELFKVMFVTNKKNKFRLGFKND